MNDMKSRNKEISYIVWIRACSVILILLCHLTQTHTNPYIVMSSQIFNVGVPLFILISGFLFGKLGIRQPYTKWLWRRLKRIFVPYWLYLIIIVLLQYRVGEKISAISVFFCVIGFQRFEYTFPGSEHTWFITAILLCYFVTPIIDFLYKKCESSKILWKVIFVLWVVLSAVVALISSEPAILTTVPFYTLAFVLGKTIDESKCSKWHMILAIILIVLVFGLRFTARIFWDDTFFI